MKKIIYPIIGALLIGTTFGLILFKNTKEEITSVFNETNTLYLFQIGVFSNEENALNEQKNFEGSIIVKDDLYYRIYYGVFKNISCIEKMKEYLEENKINYHLKEIDNVNQEFIEELSKYEEIVLQTSDTEVFIKMIAQMLKLYQSKGIK